MLKANALSLVLYIALCFCFVNGCASDPVPVGTSVTVQDAVLDSRVIMIEEHPSYRGVSVESDALIFNMNGPLPIVVGSRLVGLEGPGYMRGVTAVEGLPDGRLRVSTEELSLNQLFKHAKFSVKHFSSKNGDTQLNHEVGRSASPLLGKWLEDGDYANSFIVGPVEFTGTLAQAFFNTRFQPVFEETLDMDLTGELGDDPDGIFDFELTMRGAMKAGVRIRGEGRVAGDVWLDVIDALYRTTGKLHPDPEIRNEIFKPGKDGKTEYNAFEFCSPPISLAGVPVKLCAKPVIELSMGLNIDDAEWSADLIVQKKWDSTLRFQGGDLQTQSDGSNFNVIATADTSRQGTLDIQARLFVGLAFDIRLATEQLFEASAAFRIGANLGKTWSRDLQQCRINSVENLSLVGSFIAKATFLGKYTVPFTLLEAYERSAPAIIEACGGTPSPCAATAFSCVEDSNTTLCQEASNVQNISGNADGPTPYGVIVGFAPCRTTEGTEGRARAYCGAEGWFAQGQCIPF